MSPRANGRLVDGSVSEAAFQGAVIGLASFYGWRVFHAPDNRPAQDRRGRAGRQRVTPGWPDLTMVRGPELIFAELKAERGIVSAAQTEWLDALGEVGAAVALELDERDNRRRHNPDGYQGSDPGVDPSVEVYVWRPSDWAELEARLARGRVLQSMPAPV